MRREPGLAMLVPVVAAALAVLGPGRAAAQEADPPRSLAGDFRVRSEVNSAVEGGPERERGVLRLRLGGAWRVSETIQVGARLVTGDPDNPRTADVTVGEFLDDLEVSLDRAFVRAELGRGVVEAGKLANPFTTTELVWDGDVNPAGIAGGAELVRSGGMAVHAGGILALIDERVTGSDARMAGGQLRLVHDSGLQLAAAYWDYEIPTLAGVDPGNVRGNLTTADGTALLSDFDLLDLVALYETTVSRRPVRLTASWVRNLGAAVDEDEGWWLEVAAGREWVRRGVQLRYGYARCETDAVLGLYSHDNLPVATNYRNHTLRGAYGLRDDVSVSLTWYYFDELHGRGAAAACDGYRSRVRLDLMVRL